MRLRRVASYLDCKDDQEAKLHEFLLPNDLVAWSNLGVEFTSVDQLKCITVDKEKAGNVMFLQVVDEWSILQKIITRMRAFGQNTSRPSVEDNREKGSKDGTVEITVQKRKAARLEETWRALRKKPWNLS